MSYYQLWACHYRALVSCSPLLFNPLIDHHCVLDNVLMGPLRPLFSSNHPEYFIGNSSACAASYWHSRVKISPKHVKQMHFLSFILYQVRTFFQPQDQRKSLLHGEVESWERPALLQCVYFSSPTDFAHLHPDFRPRPDLPEACLLKILSPTPKNEFSWTRQGELEGGRNNFCPERIWNF